MLKNKTFTAESIAMQSVLCRCLGKLDKWPDVIGNQANLSYNTIHFVPMQEYGCSGSLYSLKNHHSVDDCYFECQNLTTEERIKQLSNTIKIIREKHNLLCFVDVVLNHAAINSSWLIEHPEAAFNLHDCPFLKVAWVLDDFLAKFSYAYSQKKISECANSPNIVTEKDLQELLMVLEVQIEELKLEQYFLINKAKIAENFESSMEKAKKVEKLVCTDKDIISYTLKHSHKYGERPNGVEVFP